MFLELLHQTVKSALLLGLALATSERKVLKAHKEIKALPAHREAKAFKVQPVHKVQLVHKEPPERKAIKVLQVRREVKEVKEPKGVRVQRVPKVPRARKDHKEPLARKALRVLKAHKEIRGRKAFSLCCLQTPHFTQSQLMELATTQTFLH
jgi:hypothetical protein